MISVSGEDDILQVAKNYIMKLTEPGEPEKPEQEFENSVVNYIWKNIRGKFPKRTYVIYFPL